MIMPVFGELIISFSPVPGGNSLDVTDSVSGKADAGNRLAT